MLDATDQALAGVGIAHAAARAAPCSPWPAPTPPRSTATSTTPARALDRRQRRRRRLGHRHRRPSRRRRDLRHGLQRVRGRIRRRTWRAGGWGHLLGDEGSGYWLGAQSIVAALHDRDGSGPPTALSEASLEFFRSPSVEALAASVYTTPLTKGEVAAFAVETSRLAHEGDVVARRTLRPRRRPARRADSRGRHQHRTQRRVSRRTDRKRFRAGEVFVTPLTDAIHEVAPDARVFSVEMAPVGREPAAGAARLRVRGRAAE